MAKKKDTTIDNIHEAEADHAIKNYTRVPNMLVDGYPELHPQDKWLFVCLVRLCGKAGTRHLSLRYISDKTGFSRGVLADNKKDNKPGMLRRLHNAGLIHAEIKRKKNKDGQEEKNAQYHITITDTWALNYTFFTETRPESGQDTNDKSKLVQNQDETCPESGQDNHEGVQNQDETCPDSGPNVRLQDKITESKITESKNESPDDSATQTFAPDVARPPLSSLGYSSEELIAEATRVERLSLKEECPIVTATPETTQSISTRNTPVENKPEQQSLMPDKKPKASSKSKEKHTEELNPGMLPADLKPKGPPSVPPADAPWPNRETAVQIVEAKKGRAYSKTTRAQELAEAGKVLEMAVDNAPITREQFESAWDDLASSSWWEEHGKPCMIKYLRRDDTIVGIIKKLARKGQTRTKTTSTQAQNTTTARVDEEAAKRNFDRMMASVAAKGVN